MEEYNGEVYEEVVLKDEQGRDVRFDHVLTFVYDGNYYMALLPIDEVEGIGEDEVLFMQIKKGEKDDVYETVTNEVLLDELFDEFMRLIEEMEEGEEE